MSTTRTAARHIAALLSGVGLGYIVALSRLRWRRRRQLNAEWTRADFVALFCNPKMPRSFGMRPLSFGQDMKFIMRTLPRYLLHVEPAASLYTARRALVQNRPRIVVFSGHTSHVGQSPHLCFETPDGRYDPVVTSQILIAMLLSLDRRSSSPPSDLSAAVEAHLQAQQAAGLEMAHCSRAWMERAALEFATTSERASSSPSAERSLTSTGSERSLLRGLLPLPADGSAASEAEPLLALSRLACIVLNSCCSLEIGEMLVRALPRVALDTAARAFLVGFMNKMVELDAAPSPVAPKCLRLYLWAGAGRDASSGLDLVKSAFKAGCAAFTAGGYAFGDPNNFLHPSGHPHWRQPEFKTCPHCSPPVQGQVVLLLASGGGVERIYGG
ncbi:hypothetical protein EMIHUDRAFT_224103 [Emiliania huxleyi CCMP1516]|uniref:Uncharacterized protein n=2 Tax=Emiliania huxleyi TaxID=2903 RepID=A0A0D3KSJ3_EMIH1|nr:hypothetical protein EMIHUDRAFT_224103 [Emiliania huxleyi CCMP1516]EOD38728.1 hypothetical protein EMIHUDRAFT_224103 [Emiliania huxleyi CCMP1516]|eukprot:XP_005791157.1 hypothetical protein EMIHUDRAFT_224103 [Emiliania huxleyi CCMP1516]